MSFVVASCSAINDGPGTPPLLIRQWHSLCLYGGIDGDNTMPNSTLRHRLPIGLLRATAFACACSSTVFAQGGHRARLSRDLADRIAQRLDAPTEIIVSAPDATVDQLVRRYGATLKKRLQGGSVLIATG